MPRKQQRRRPAFRPSSAGRGENTALQAAIEARARQLAATYDLRALQSLVTDLRSLRDEADRVAFEQPSPDALRAYRNTVRELAEAERALSLAQPTA